MTLENERNQPPTSSRTFVTQNPLEPALGTTRNPAMQEALNTIRRIAATDISVLIVGEHGTGKEWAAHSIHRLSNRTNGPFHSVECSAIPPENIEKEIFGYEAINWNGVEIKRGAFEEASGGTLLLDEIEFLPAALQLKIARILEYQSVRRISGGEELPVNTRLISTLSQPADTPFDEDLFRKELFYRASPMIIELPPLRKRREDIEPLIANFQKELQQRFGSTARGISARALEMCRGYEWPGNIRHLRNAIEYASVMCKGEVIEPNHLPLYLQEKSIPRSEP